MYAISKSAFIKLFILMTVLVVAGYLLVYQVTLKKVDQELKNQQNKGGSVSISTADLQKDFVSLQQGTGSPQTGSLNITGNIQGSTLTSTIQDGTSPINVNSSTLVKSLNADMVDGRHAEDLSNPASSTILNNITNTTTGESIKAGTNAQYFRGDKSWQSLNTSVVQGLGSLATQNTVNNSNWSGLQLSVANGGTGATDSTTARTNLGLGSMALQNALTWTGANSLNTLGTITQGTWNGSAIQDAYIGSSGNWNTAYSDRNKWDGGATGLTALTGRTSLGLGSLATASSVNNSNWSGTQLSVANGGTGATDTTTARTNLGLGSSATLGYNSTNLQNTSGNLNTIQDIASSSTPTFGGMTLNGALSATSVSASGTLNITGTGTSSIGGNVSFNSNDGSQLVTNGGFTGNANGWTLGTGYTYGSNSVTHGSNGTDPLYQDISNVTGETYSAENVTNGSFTGSAAGWGWIENGWVYSSNAMSYVGGTDVLLGQDLSQIAPIVPNTLYKIKFKISGMTTGKSIDVNIGGTRQFVVSSNGYHTAYLTTPTGGNSWMVFENSSTSNLLTIDDVSVKKVTGASYGEEFSQSYKATFTVSGMTAGSFTPLLGEAAGSPITGNGTYTQYLNAKPNANIVSFVPTSNALFTITNVAVVPVQNGVITVQDIITKGPKVDVRAYGAKGDGITDDTAAIQAAQNSLPDTGGILYFPPGTFLGHVTLKSNIHIEGSGINASILKLPNGANTDVITTNGFSALTGTDSMGGVNRVTIENITIDGNKASNSTGYGIRKYGAQWNVHDVVIRNCAQDGVWSSWGSYANPPPGFDSMEDKLTNIWVTLNAGNGITWYGPHDSIFDNILVFLNSGDGIVAAGGGGILNNSHIWANSQTGNGIWVKTNLTVHNTTVEGEGGAGGIGINVDPAGGGLLASGLNVFLNTTGIYLGAGGNQITSSNIHGNATGMSISGWTNDVTDVVFSGNTTGLAIINGGFNQLHDLRFGGNTTGLQVGTAGLAQGNNDISAKFNSNTTHINWANAGNASNVLQASVWTATGETALAGTPSSSNKIDILSAGAGANTNNSTFTANVGIGVASSLNKLAVNAPVTADTLATTIITPTVATNKGLVVQGYTGQTADLIQANSSANAVLFKIDSSGNLTAKSATFTGTLTMNGHIITGNSSGSTTIAVHANAGTGATASITGNDTSGTITVTTGTVPTAGTLATVTFAGAYGSAPNVVIAPKTNANGATLQYYTIPGTSNFTLNSGNAPAASTAYTYSYHVMQ